MCGMVWCDVWCGVRYGGGVMYGGVVVVRCGVVWCDAWWCDGGGAVRCGVMHGGGTARCGAVRCGVVWCGVVWCGVVWCGGGAVRYASPASARDANISLFPGHPRDTPGEQVSHPEHRNIRSDNPAQHNNTTRQHTQQAT